MRGFLIGTTSFVLAVGAAVAVLAQLTDTQTASGTVTVSSTSADLYICEPGATPGPECGSDDSLADEAVFETLENIRPGGIVEWDIRIKNMGSQDFVITGAPVTIVETADPGGDCPDNAMQAVQIGFFFPPAVPGVLLLGKNGDPVNDNPGSVPGAAVFAYESFGSIFARPVKVAAGDYEDLRLRLQLPLTVPAPTPTAFPTPTPATTEHCDGNEWNVSFVLTVV